MVIFIVKLKKIAIEDSTIKRESKGYGELASCGILTVVFWWGSELCLPHAAVPNQQLQCAVSCAPSDISINL